MVNLSSLTYRPRVTNLAAGTCSTVDFVVLLLGRAGSHGMPLSAIYIALSAFRNKPLNLNKQVGCCNHLFNRVYGYVSQARDPNVLWRQFFYRFSGPVKSAPQAPAACFLRAHVYRVRAGVYALNANGLARYARLVGSAG